MRILLSILCVTLLTISVSADELGDFPKTIDLNDHQDRQVIVDQEKGQYLGHPTTCLLEDGKRL